MNSCILGRGEDMVQITDMAKGKIQEILDRNRGKHVRLFIRGMG